MQETAVRKEFERSDITLLPRSTGGAARAQTPCNCIAARPVSCHICNSIEALVMQLGAPRRSPPVGQIEEICESRSRRLRERATRCRRASGLRKKVPLASGDDRAGYAYFSFFLVCYRPLASRLRLASAQTNDRIPRDMCQTCCASHKYQRDLAYSHRCDAGRRG